MQQQLINVFPTSIRPKMKRISWDGLEEIRIRIGWPMELIYDNRSEWLGMIDRYGLNEMLNYITGYSLYAMDEELKQGFLTLDGGHRIGITGHTTYHDTLNIGNTKVTNIVDIGGLNFRIAHEKKNCAKQILPFLRKGQLLYNTILFAVPGVGKTTYLRDLIRLISNGDKNYRGLKVCVVDERSEIGACYMGKARNDLGVRTDILDGCPKDTGMKMMLRSMSPQVIAVDELGKETEFQIVEEMRCCGVNILGTMHAGSIQELLENPLLKKCISNSSIERFVELYKKSDGERSFKIYDKGGCELDK